MLISGSLCGFSIFFFLHFGAFFFGEFGMMVGLVVFFFFDVLFFCLGEVFSGVLVVVAGTGGGLAF